MCDLKCQYIINKKYKKYIGWIYKPWWTYNKIESLKYIQKNRNQKSKIKEESDEKNRYIEAVYHIYEKAKFCPVEKCGKVNM